MGEQGVRFHPRIKIRGFPAHSYNDDMFKRTTTRKEQVVLSNRSVCPLEALIYLRTWFALSTIMCYDEMTFKMLQKELNSDGRENKSIPP